MKWLRTRKVRGDYLDGDQIVHVDIAADDHDGQHAGDTAAAAGHDDPTETDVATDADLDDMSVHVGGHRIAMPVYIPAIDWGVIAIIVGSSLFVDITSKSGLFTWIAVRVTKASGGDPSRLLLFYGLMTVLFSAVLNNVTAMIIVGSLTAVSLGQAWQE